LSLDTPEYDEPLAEARDNYDPNLVDKNKLGVLINLLRLQLSDVGDKGQRQRLLHSVDRLEAEVRRPKVRWSAVIMGCFVLLGVLADLKSLFPAIYDKPLRTMESIITVLHEDAQVQRRRDFFGGPAKSGGAPTIPTPRPLDYPQLATPPKIEDDD
jgi:hypothetical protein